MATAAKRDAGTSTGAEELSFEAAAERLEAIVHRLEHADLELEESLAHFEEGVRLSKECAARLDAAERRIEVLTREGGEWVARPFEPVDGVDGVDGVDASSGDDGGASD